MTPSRTANPNRSFQVVVRADVTAAMIRPVPYTKGQCYRPDRITLTYRWSDDRPAPRVEAELHGSRVRKDGSAGVERKTETLYGHSEVPDWVAAAVREYMPVAS